MHGAMNSSKIINKLEIWTSVAMNLLRAKKTIFRISKIKIETILTKTFELVSCENWIVF